LPWLALRWRVGGCGRLILAVGDHETVIGLMDTAALATSVVDCHNLRLGRIGLPGGGDPIREVFEAETDEEWFGSFG